MTCDTRRATLVQRLAITLPCAVSAIFLAVPAIAEDGDSLSAIPHGEAPLQVSVGFNLINLTDVNKKEETIDFEGALYMNWMDRRLAYDAAAVGTYDFVPGDYSRAPRRIYQGDFAVKELFEGWRLHFNVPNGIGDRSTTNMAISIWPDGMVEYSETFFARVETPMNLRRFPFDRQELEIFFHPFVYARDEVVLVADDRLARTWNQNLGIAQWRRESVRMTERPTEIAYFDESRQAVSEFVVILEIARRPAHVVVSIITPLIILVSLSWSVFWMDQASLTERINITFIGILSVVAYYFVVLDSVPEIAYLTLMDGFLLATFLLLAAGTIVNVVVDRLDRSERGTTGDRLDRACRWAFPLGYALITLAVVVYFFSY